MKRLMSMIVLMCVALFSTSAGSYAEDIAFENVDIPKLDWGTQTAVFTVKNNSDYLKFLKTSQELTFDGIYLEPDRLVTSSFVVLPQTTVELPLEIQIPGNYGTAELMVTIYDVVDTLDPIFPGQEIYEQLFQLTFEPDEDAREYLDLPIQAPPTTQEAMDFDYEFARLLSFMVARGKSLEDIEDLTIADEGYAGNVIDSLVARQYMTQTPDGPRPAFPVLNKDQATKGAQLAAEVAEKLTAAIASNLQSYPRALDSLIKAGLAPQDSNVFMHGGTILHFRYPMVTVGLLWYDLGQEFISHPILLDIYKNTDPCNSHTPRYMYLVQGPDSIDGTHFYHAAIEPSKFVLNFSDHEPPLECVEAYWTIHRPLLERLDWTYPSLDSPEPFIIDTAAIHAALRHLRQGAPEIIAQAKIDLENLQLVENPIEGHFGLRYWFWNLVATRTTQALLDRGLMNRRENGIFRLEMSRMRQP